MFGATASAHANRTSAVVQPNRDATSTTCGAWSSELEPEPSGANGTNAMPRRTHSSSTGVEARFARWNAFCTHDDLGEAKRMAQMRKRDVAQADRRDQPVIASLYHRRELLVEERVRPGVSHQPEIHDRELLEIECPQVVLDAATQLGRFVVGEDATSIIAAHADLRNDHQIGWVRMERIADQLVHDVRAVVLRSVDVVHSALDRLP